MLQLILIVTCDTQYVRQHKPKHKHKWVGCYGLRWITCQRAATTGHSFTGAKYSPGQHEGRKLTLQWVPAWDESTGPQPQYSNKNHEKKSRKEKCKEKQTPLMCVPEQSKAAQPRGHNPITTGRNSRLASVQAMTATYTLVQTLPSQLTSP